MLYISTLNNFYITFPCVYLKTWPLISSVSVHVVGCLFTHLSYLILPQPPMLQQFCSVCLRTNPKITRNASQ